MPRITFILKDGLPVTIEAAENLSLMQAAVEAGIAAIDPVCGGSMACAGCHVIIHPDWAARVEAQDNEKTEEEEDILDLAFDTAPTSRLSCQIRLTAALDGLVVYLPGSL